MWFIGVVVASVALVCYSFNAEWMEGLPKWVVMCFRVVGFVGTIVFPTVFVKEYTAAKIEEEMSDEQD